MPSESRNRADAPLTVQTAQPTARVTAVEAIAVGLSLLWLIGAAVFFVMMPTDDAGNGSLDSLRFVMTWNHQSFKRCNPATTRSRRLRSLRKRCCP